MVIVIFRKAQSTLSPKCDHYYLINFKFCNFPPRNTYLLKTQKTQICNTSDLLQGFFPANERLFFIIWNKDSTFRSRHQMAGEESDESCWFQKPLDEAMSFI